jgi:RecA-family ATPase
MATARSTTERTVTESSRINERITELATRYRAQPIARNGNGKGAVIRIVDDDHPPDDHPPDDSLPQPINWHELYQRDVQVEWLVPDFWPVGRQLHLHAPKKSGKSLVMFWIVANLARGRDPFTGRPTPPVTVGYCDYEMTPDDVLERAEAMGFVPDDLANLKYYLLPTLPPLDTPHGGDALIKLLHRDGVQAVVLDTLSRVVAGEENSNDTVQNFYRYTGVALKRHDIALARLDHEGHETGRSRGASTKTEDVDVVWQISPTDTGIDLVRKATRVPWIPDRINLHRTDDPLTFRRVGGSWPPGTIDKAAELDRIGVPDDASYRTARKALTDHGLKPGRNDLIRAALKFRRERSDDHD